MNTLDFTTAPRAAAKGPALDEARALLAELRRPIHPDALLVRQSGAGPLVYIDAREVMDRLDALSPLWQSSFREVDGGVECTITLTLSDGTTISRSDVGTNDARSDSGMSTKARFSDGLKRAGVQLGVGRCLYGGFSLPRAFNAGDVEGARELYRQWLLDEGQAIYGPAWPEPVQRTADDLRALAKELISGGVIESADVVAQMGEELANEPQGRRIDQWHPVSIAIVFDALKAQEVAR